MAVKTAAFPAWKESRTLLSSRDDSMPSSKGVAQTRRKPALLCLDLSLCCCLNMENSVDSPLSAKQLLGRESRWAVTTDSPRDGGKFAVAGSAAKSQRETIFSRNASTSEDSWFAQTFRRSRKQGQDEGRDGSKMSQSEPKGETGAHVRTAGAASWWGEASAPKRQPSMSVKDSSSFRSFSRSGSVLSRSSSNKKRTHEMIYSGNAKWKKILRRVLNEARKIHVPAVRIDGPYNYDMLNYGKNFDVCPDDDAKPIRFRSLGSASFSHLQAELSAQLDCVRSDDEGEIVQESSPARKSSRSLSPVHSTQ